MFDSETSKLLRSAPSLSGLDSNNFPLFFTRHYAELSMARLRGHHELMLKRLNDGRSIRLLMHMNLLPL